MKKLIIFMLFFLFCTAILAAQQKKFNTKEELIEADEIGTAGFYESSFKLGHVKLSAGESEKTFPDRIFVKMHVVGGNFWVLQKSGTVFIADSTGKIIRREDCGNKIFEIMIPPPKKVVKAEPPTESVVMKNKIDVYHHFDPITLTLISPTSDNDNHKEKSSFRNSFWPYVIGAAILGAGVGMGVWASHHENHNTTAAATGVAPGGTTLPAFKMAFVPPPSISIGFSVGIGH